MSQPTATPADVEASAAVETTLAAAAGAPRETTVRPPAGAWAGRAHTGTAATAGIHPVGAGGAAGASASTARAAACAAAASSSRQRTAAAAALVTVSLPGAAGPTAGADPGITSASA